MVAAGVGATIVPGCVRSFHQPGLKYIRIEPAPPPMHIVATRPAGEPQPTLAAFLNILRQQLLRIRSKYTSVDSDRGAHLLCRLESSSLSVSDIGRRDICSLSAECA